MSNPIKAKIRWLTSEEGGRKNPPCGRRYAATFELPNNNKELCSIIIYLDGAQKGNVSDQEAVGVGFLAEDIIKPKLYAGAPLKITEGNRVVAECTIVSA